MGEKVCLDNVTIYKADDIDVILHVSENNRVTALKILKDQSWSRELLKEVTALQRLRRHPNIVEFYGREFDSSTNLPCLVMEYCSSGSLYSYLKEVENIHGLPDAEFRILLHDITCGLAHLREHGCVHRDIKPGNILRNITQEGKSVYKISDFGASRLLSENSEEFFSLAGTEEYLHPHMYNKAFINKRSHCSFNHKVDMWSLGCTLFQAITGEMPYKPFQGARNDKSIMYEMVSSKPHGAISGCQYIAGGDIIWQRDLPAKCNMTSDLRHYLIKILVGLMDADPKYQWTFETYRSEVTQILALKCISILYCDEQKIHQIYMAPSKSLAEFKDRVAYYTDLQASYQNLYYNQHRLSLFLKGRLDVEAFPPTDLNKPICLMSSQYTETSTNLRLSLEPYDSFNIMSSISGDIKVATSQCDTINDIYKRMKEVEAAINGSYNITLTLWSDFQQRFARMVKIYQLWSDSYQQTELYLDLIKSSSDDNLQNGRNSQMNKIFKFQVLTEFYEKLKNIKGQLTSCQYEEVWCTPPVRLDNHWCTLVGTLFQTAKDILYRMQDRKKLNMTEIEQLQHSADRSVLQELTARCVYLWQTPCATERKHSVKEYERCKKKYIDGVVKLTKLERELKNLDRAREECKVKFQEEILKHFTSSTKIDARGSSELHQEVSIAKNKPNNVQHVRIPSSILPTRTGRSLRHLNDELKQHRSRFQKEISELPEIQVWDLDGEDGAKSNVEQDNSEMVPVIGKETEISKTQIYDGTKPKQAIKKRHALLKTSGLKDEGYHTNALSPFTEGTDGISEDGENVTESGVVGHNDSEENKVGAGCSGYTQTKVNGQVDTTTDNRSSENVTVVDAQKPKVQSKPLSNLECAVPISRVPQISVIEEGGEFG